MEKMHEYRDWQREIESEKNYDKRKLIIFDHLDSIGINTSDWEERIASEKAIKNDK